MVTAALPASHVEAEAAVLCAALTNDQAVHSARQLLTVDDFYQPRHQVIFAAICDLAEAGRRVDPIVVLERLSSGGHVPAKVDASYLHTLYSQPAVPEHIAYYAERLRDATRRRRISAIATKLSQIVVDIGDSDEMLTHAAGELIALQLVVDEPDPTAPVTGLYRYDEFNAADVPAQTWLIPRLIERQDVFLILGTPGSGKSWLSRQICMSAAAGVHPFRPMEPIDPVRTLLVDLENPTEMLRRQSHSVQVGVTTLFGQGLNDRAWVWSRPDGLNLRKRADADLLERVVVETQPQIIALGSLYKAFQRGSDDWDTAAEETRAVFDRIRSRYGCAFWLEHHMPKSASTGPNANPFGSSVWERWPGFGRVLRRINPEQDAYELASTFRGDRDIRDIPVGLVRGGSLPWTAVFDEEELAFYAKTGRWR